MSKYDEAIECAKYLLEAKAAAEMLRKQAVHGALYITGKYDQRVEALYKRCAFEARLKIADHMERLARQELRKANAAARAEASGILGIKRRVKAHGKKGRTTARHGKAARRRG